MSFGNYGDADVEKKRRIAISCTICLLLMAVVCALAVGFKEVGETGDNPIEQGKSGSQISTTSKTVTAICQPTDFKETCVDSLKSANTSDPKELIRLGFQVAVDALKKAMENSTTLKELAEKDSRTRQALENCDELMDSAIDDLENSFDKLGRVMDVSRLGDYVSQLKIWLSGAITFEESCLDEFENITNNDVGEKMKKILQASMELTSNGLAMLTGLSSVLDSFNTNPRRLLVFHQYSDQDGGMFTDHDKYPSWVSPGRRKLISTTPISTQEIIKADAIVAKDGSGQFETITDALTTVPKNNKKTFVIYIKEGVQETVMVTKKMTNVMFTGDGPTKTKITGNMNYVDGIQTMKTATVSVLGANFMAKDIGFENSAGAIKHQAVALRVQSDKSVFYNCRIDGYQDTLYVHAHAQFYRDCTISGTIDFIFGNAAVVFPNCKIIVRKPLDNQNCIVTASGRNNTRSVTGIVLQNCTITGDREYLEVKDVNKAYLGRPWKEYSRTIIMQSQIDGIIHPEGWLPWMGEFALDTCWYGEYGNRGPGADCAVQTGTVTWKGIKKIDAKQANRFTVAHFVEDDWIKPTGVPYFSRMMNV